MHYTTWYVRTRYVNVKRIFLYMHLHFLLVTVELTVRLGYDTDKCNDDYDNKQ